MIEAPVFSSLASYRWQPFGEHGDSDDLVCHYGQGEQVADSFRRDVLELRRLYPELSHFGLIGLFWAWSAFETDHLLVGSTTPHRTEAFLGYIILRSVAGFAADPFPGSGGYEEIDQALRWRDGKDVLPTPN